MKFFTLLIILIFQTGFAKAYFPQGIEKVNGFNSHQIRTVELQLNSAKKNIQQINWRYKNMPLYRKKEALEIFFGKENLELKNQVIELRLKLSQEKLNKMKSTDFFSTQWARENHPNKSFIKHGLPETDNDFYAAVNWYGLGKDDDTFIYDPYIYLSDAYFTTNSREQTLIIWHEVSHLVGASEDEIRDYPDLYDVYLSIPTIDYDVQIKDDNSLEDSYVWEMFLEYLHLGKLPKKFWEYKRNHNHKMIHTH